MARQRSAVNIDPSNAARCTSHAVLHAVVHCARVDDAHREAAAPRPCQREGVPTQPTARLVAHPSVSSTLAHQGAVGRLDALDRSRNPGNEHVREAAITPERGSDGQPQRRAVNKSNGSDRPAYMPHPKGIGRRLSAKSPLPPHIPRVQLKNRADVVPRSERGEHVLAVHVSHSTIVSELRSSSPAIGQCSLRT